MKNVVVVWDEEKYGYYSEYRTYELYERQELEINFTIKAKNVIPKFIDHNGLFYQVYTTILDTTNKELIYIVYKM